MPRVAFIHGSNDLYGASRVLLQDIAVFRQRGWDVTVTLPTDGPLTGLARNAGAQVAVSPLRVLRKVDGLRGLRPPTAPPPGTADADLVVVWTLALASYLPALAIRRRRVITSVHEILDGRAGTLLARGAGALSSALMSNSNTTSEWLLSTGVRGDLVSMAYPEAPAYDPLPAAADGASVFSMVLAGRVNGHKGHIEAVRASEIARQEGVELRLVLIGGSYPGQERHRDDLLATIDGKPWANFIGEVDSVRSHLLDAHAVLVPTTQPEPFGVVALEAWAAGRRVIASDTGGLAEATRMVDGVSVRTGDVRDLAAAIVRVARDPELRKPPRNDAEASQVCTAAAREAAWTVALRRAGTDWDNALSESEFHQ